MPWEGKDSQADDRGPVRRPQLGPQRLVTPSSRQRRSIFSISPARFSPVGSLETEVVFWREGGQRYPKSAEKTEKVEETASLGLVRSTQARRRLERLTMGALCETRVVYGG